MRYFEAKSQSGRAGQSGGDVGVKWRSPVLPSVTNLDGFDPERATIFPCTLSRHVEVAVSVILACSSPRTRPLYVRSVVSDCPPFSTVLGW